MAANNDPTAVNFMEPRSKNIFNVIFHDYYEAITTQEDADKKVRETGQPIFRPSATQPNALTLTYPSTGGAIGNTRYYLVDSTGGIVSKEFIARVFPSQMSGGKRKSRKTRRNRRN